MKKLTCILSAIILLSGCNVSESNLQNKQTELSDSITEKSDVSEGDLQNQQMKLSDAIIGTREVSENNSQNQQMKFSDTITGTSDGVNDFFHYKNNL